MSSAASKTRESDHGPLVDLVSNDIGMARLFVKAARAAFSTGMIRDGEFTRLRAIKFYCCALRAALELSAVEREQFSSDIDYLRIQIEWLLTQSKNQDPKLLLQEEAFMNNLLQLLTERS